MAKFMELIKLLLEATKRKLTGKIEDNSKAKEKIKKLKDGIKK